MLTKMMMEAIWNPGVGSELGGYNLLGIVSTKLDMPTTDQTRERQQVGEEEGKTSNTSATTGK